MSEKRFVCIDVGYGDDWYITDNGKRLSEMEIVGLLNEQSERIKSLEMELDLIANTKLFSRRKLEEENKQLKKENEQLKNRLNKGL